MDMFHVVKLVIFSYFMSIGLGKVIELDSSFKEIVEDGSWLVKFYAPWCGYCKKLEPVYEELSQSLQDTPVKVARLDATKYPDIASIYHIRGYPTIKYINGTDIYTHDGERTVNHLVQFTKRCFGIALKHIPSEGRFIETLKDRKDELFYLFIGSQESHLKKVFEEVANNFRLLSYYYSIEKQSIPEDIITKLPLKDSLDETNGTILVWKSKTYQKAFIYNSDNEKTDDGGGSLSTSLRNWILQNRFAVFPRISTQGELLDFSVLHKPIVIFLLNGSELSSTSTDTTDDESQKKPTYYSMAKKLSTSDDKFVQSFMYVYTTEVHLINDLAMTFVPIPSVVVYIPDNMTIYLHPEYQDVVKMKSLTDYDIHTHLTAFVNGQLTGFGGVGFFPKLRRAGYDFMSGLVEFVTTAPLLAMFVIGVPLSVLSFLFYAICCMDTYEGEQDIAYRKAMRAAQKREKQPIYQAPLRSCEELNIEKPDSLKKND